MSTCNRIDELRDYAMGERGTGRREAIESHVAGCGECAAELRSLRLTTAALRSLPDREIPQRIAFVSDKVFGPSLLAGWWGGLWNSAARLGFASACVLALAVTISIHYRPAAAQPAGVIQAGITKADLDRAVTQAVGEAVARVKAEDEQYTAAALAESDRRHNRQHQALMVAMDENMSVLQKRLSTYTMLASNDEARFGGGR